MLMKNSRKMKKGCKGRKRMSKKIINGGWVNNIHENQTRPINEKIKYYFTTGFQKYPFFKLTSGSDEINNIKDWFININKDNITLTRKFPEPGKEDKIIFNFDDKNIDLTISDGPDFNQWDFGLKEDYDFTNWPTTKQDDAKFPDEQPQMKNAEVIENEYSKNFEDEDPNTVINPMYAQDPNTVINPMHAQSKGGNLKMGGRSSRRRSKRRRNNKKRRVSKRKR